MNTTTPTTTEEIALLRAKIEALQSQLEEYRIDPVFKILTRRGLEESWSEIEDKRPLAIAYIDIDDLKVQNSTLGMNEVNKRVKNAFQYVRQNIRKSDTTLIGRYYSGDEMLIVCPEEEIENPCQRVTEGLKEQGLTATITITNYKGEDSLTEAVKYVNRENQRCKLIEKGKIYWV